MSRLGRRHRMTTIAVAMALLAVPAAADAATYTVAAGGGACGGTDTACESLTAAAAVAIAGDSVQVAPGTYHEAPTFTAPGVTVTGSTTAPVAITGTVTFSGSGATPSVLEKLLVAPSAAGAGAVVVSGTAGVAVRDAFLISGAGPGMLITGGAGNEITRSTLVSGAADGKAVDIQSATASVSLVLSSSILSGGAGGTGLSATTGVGLGSVPGMAAPVNVTARHITIAGSANAIVLDSSAALAAPLGPAVGSIAATVSDSIALGTVTTSHNAGVAAGLPLIGPAAVPANTAAVAFTRTDQATPAAQLFVNSARRNFHLRADAPAIDNAQITTGDSATDVDGQPRTVGAASDQGADEFLNTAPTAALVVRTAKPRANQPVLLDGSGSSDREAASGGGIVQYQWNFGDGTTQTTTTPTVQHTYAGEGAVAAQLVVVDKQGASSAPAVAGVTIVDGVPPTVTITKPFAKQRIRLVKKTTKTVTTNGVKRKVTTTRKVKLAFTGVAKDKSGVAFVLLTLEKLGTASSSQCTWFDGKKGLIKTSCKKPKLLVAKLAKDGTWAYTISLKVKQPSAGLYRASVYGADATGAFGNSAATKDSIIRFRIVK